MRVLILASVLLAACGDTDNEADNDAIEQVFEVPPTPDDVAEVPANAEKTPSGLASRVLKKGTGKAHPTEKSLVTVHYTGWKTDGEMFDSSIKRGTPAQFGLNQVIKGWTEGVQLMVKGESRRFWIPADLAYGDEGKGGRPSGMLVFDIHLLDIVNPPEQLTAPADAKKTESGLAYKVLKKGEGPQPTLEDRVHLHFIAWKADGELIQSSYSAPEPRMFRLEGAIPGWKEAIQLMHVGEKARFWMPESLVQMPRAPQGDQIFDFELVAVDPPVPAPADVAAPPADAIKTDSGLAYKVLKKGEGTEKPGEQNIVDLSFTGWTASDGKMFDTTTYAEKPAKLPVSGIPASGLQEAVKDMVKGEKRRVWLPQELAFSGSPRAPEGMVVYEVELHDIAASAPRALPPRLQQQLQDRTKLPQAKPATEGSK